MGVLERPTLSFRQSKTGQLVNVRAPGPLRAELASAKREANEILTNRQGQRYTRDGLQTNLWKLVSDPIAEKRACGTRLMLSWAAPLAWRAACMISVSTETHERPHSGTAATGARLQTAPSNALDVHLATSCGRKQEREVKRGFV